VHWHEKKAKREKGFKKIGEKRYQKSEEEEKETQNK